MDGMWRGCEWMGCGEGVSGLDAERVSEDISFTVYKYSSFPEM